MEKKEGLEGDYEMQGTDRDKGAGWTWLGEGRIILLRETTLRDSVKPSQIISTQEFAFQLAENMYEGRGGDEKEPHLPRRQGQTIRVKLVILSP